MGLIEDLFQPIIQYFTTNGESAVRTEPEDSHIHQLRQRGYRMVEGPMWNTPRYRHECQGGGCYFSIETREPWSIPPGYRWERAPDLVSRQRSVAPPIAFDQE